MKIGFYNPYFDSLGGGERYVLTLASYLSDKNDVRIFWHNSEILSQVQDRLGIELSKVRVAESIFNEKNLIKRLRETQKYDLLFILSDGSIPSSFARCNILHFQRPFQNRSYRSLKTRIKLSRYQRIVCNSRFTKSFIDKELCVNSIVIYPPVSTSEFYSQEKECIIISVGRFGSSYRNKKQLELIEAFRRLYKKFPNARLVLAGGLIDKNYEYFENVKKAITGLPVEVYANISFLNLKKLYARSIVYWHGAGFGEDEAKDPESMEHFGISTVEAMASGCIPVVFDGGGQREIVQNEVNGFLWKSQDELIKKTLLVLESNKLQKKLQIQAIKRAKSFDERYFTNAFDTLLKDIT